MDEETARSCEPACSPIVYDTELQGQNQKWRYNTGAISALIITLQGLCTRPKTPWEWITREAQVLRPARKKLREHTTILSAVRKAVEEKFGKVAPQGHNGARLEMGVPNVKLTYKTVQNVKW